MSDVCRSIWLAGILATALCVSACGDDDTTTDAGETDTGGQDPGTDFSGQEWEPTLYRFTDFNITDPAGIGPILNGLIRVELENGRLNLLLQTSNFDPPAGEAAFTMEASSGVAHEDGTYSFADDPEDVAGTVQENGYFTNDEVTQLGIPVTFYIDPVCADGPCSECRTNDDCEEGFICGDAESGECEKIITIPLNELMVTGYFGINDDGLNVIEVLDLNGVILKEDADTIVFNMGERLFTLTEVLDEDQMDYPETGEQTGWWMAAQVYCEEVEAHTE